jgi:hypothetical protein
LPRLITSASSLGRIDSDAESLPFPAGGVFGTTPRRNPFRIGVPSVSNEITRTLARMQDQINRLRDEVESSDSPLSDTWPPKAA